MAGIIFICGSLEPGRDGVGDYAQRLAATFAGRGIPAGLLALSDRFVAQPTDDAGLRLPAGMPAPERYRLAARFLADQAPDWVSLQFVSWDFGWKGIVLGEGARLARLLATYRRHLMVHETWVTGTLEAVPSGMRRLRRSVLGQIQRRATARLIRLFRPDLIHTSTELYQRHLAGIGVAARQLPLFGNIPLAEPGDWPRLRALVQHVAGSDLGGERSAILLAGLFGALRPVPIEPALRRLVEAAAGRRAVLLAMGEPGADGPQRLASWRQAAPDLKIIPLGPLDPARLSACFDQLDIAVSLHPASVVGRSGAVAALLEHGVPVICPWQALPGAADLFAARWRGLLLPADASVSRFLADPPPRQRHPDIVERTVDQLMSDQNLVR